MIIQFLPRAWMVCLFCVVNKSWASTSFQEVLRNTWKRGIIVYFSLIFLLLTPVCLTAITAHEFLLRWTYFVLHFPIKMLEDNDSCMRNKIIYQDFITYLSLHQQFVRRNVLKDDDDNDVYIFVGLFTSFVFSRFVYVALHCYVATKQNGHFNSALTTPNVKKDIMMTSTVCHNAELFMEIS